MSKHEGFPSMNKPASQPVSPGSFCTLTLTIISTYFYHNQVYASLVVPLLTPNLLVASPVARWGWTKAASLGFSLTSTCSMAVREEDRDRTGDGTEDRMDHGTGDR